MRVAVVGGGPGGLFAATLIKRGDPTAEVTVLERNRADDTFGFGVVFSDATLAGINAADPVLLTALTEHGVHWDPIEVRLQGQRFRCGGNGMAAVERKALLALLQQGAVDAGVDVRFSTEADLEAVVGGGHDLVVAADGASSRLRARFAGAFAPSVETAAAKFIWLGTTYPFEGLTFVHERGPHGVFAVHGYPIGNGVSTFIVETDEASWRAAGLDAFDVTQPPGASDEVSRAYLADLFAEQIDGHPLLVNNSRWGNFRTHRAERWTHLVGSTHVVLLGDAAHTAHFSVGSGTKMAMEDAIALADAVGRHGRDLAAAVADYEAVRQPKVARIQGSARPSLSWWEHFGRSHDSLPPWQFAYHFFTRSLTDAKLATRDEAFVAAAHQRWHDAHGRPPLDSPFDLDGREVAHRVVTVERGPRPDATPAGSAERGTVDGDADAVGGDAVVLAGGLRLPLGAEAAGPGPWALLVAAPAAEADLPGVLDDVAKGIAAGARLVAVEGGSELTQRLVCEAARLVHGTASLLVEDADTDTAVTAVLSGRTDFVTGLSS